ncbi:MAG: DNA repair protein RecO C-terminal domain-containing protein [Odoribacteraceae bacterium]|jgi:DNA repair protein RecO (recombination protein O)|nr:DNA repair protein RecO C-terminal domain-containing protein [Odoribacteraceae bacterium]
MEVVNAIVLKSVPFVERQRIIRLFSLEHGFLSMMTPAFPNRRGGIGTARAMQVVEVEFARSARGELHALRSIRPTRDTSTIGSDVFKMNIALLWSEVLCLILRHEARNEPLYDYLRRSVEYLDVAGDDVANFNLFFLYRLCDLLGFRIETSSYREGYLFNLRDGLFCPSCPSAGDVIGPRAAGAIYRLCCTPLQSIREIPLNGEGRGILLNVVLSFIGRHLDVDFNTKSIQVIREVFA